MLKDDLLRFSLEASGLTAAWALLRRLGMYRDRGANEVVPYLRRLDLAQIEQLFNPLLEQAAGFWDYRVYDEIETVREREDAPVLRKIVSHALTTDWNEGNELIRLLFRASVEARRLMESEFLPQPKIERLEKFWFISKSARRSQRERLDLAREFIRCMCHNAEIVQQWANTERFYLIQGLRVQRGKPGGIPPNAANDLPAIDALRRTAKACRFACIAALSKIWFLMFLRFDQTRLLPIPSVAALAQSGRTILLLAYQEMKDAAALLGNSYGEEFVEELRAAM